MYHILRRNSEYIFWFIHTPLIVVISLVCVFVWNRRRSIASEYKQLTEFNSISGDELVLHRKNAKINRYTINILIFILTIANMWVQLSVYSNIPRSYGRWI